jgi:hypothetical protein
MSNDIAKFFGGHQQPDRKKALEAMANYAASKAALSGNQALLRLTKTGQWVFGSDSTKLKDGTVLIADPASQQSGYVAWWLGKPESEVMQPLHMGPVDPSKLPEVNSGSVPPGAKKESGKGWEAQCAISFITQDKIPLALLYKASSLGGKKACLTLAGDIMFGMTENPARCYPVVELQVDSYQHKEYGEVFNPMFVITGWLDEKGEPVNDLAKLSKDGLL